MAFDNVRLPEDIERGSQSIPRFQTTITTLGRGAEQRNADWAQQRMKYDVSYGIQSEEDYHNVRDFFMARLGRARGFLFKDWSDYWVENQQIATGDGVRTTFQLVRRYTSGVTYERTILAPVSGTVQMFVNGTPTASSVNLSTGVVTISPAPAASAVIAASFEFDVPVRFNTDEFPIELHIFDAASIGSIEIVELPTRA
jgi:uncharacterized protein (TIGR02217 family)